MPFFCSSLGLKVMCSLGLGNLVAFDWNDLPVGREFVRNSSRHVYDDRLMKRQPISTAVVKIDYKIILKL